MISTTKTNVKFQLHYSFQCQKYICIEKKLKEENVNGAMYRYSPKVRHGT